MAQPLDRYNRKRDFTRTEEPPGKPSSPNGKRLRFVVQHHVASRDHFDFRLEWDGSLKSWAVPKGPSYNPHDKRLAVQVEDHPYAYKDFEGAIPKGQYGGGTVMIWDEGYWEPLEDGAEAFAKGSLKFTLDGSRLMGKWALVHMKPRAGEKDVNWLLIKEKDPYENAYDVKQFVTSVRTGRTMAEIAAAEEGEAAEESEPEGKKDVATAQKTKTKKSGADKKQGDLILSGVTITSPEKVLYEETGITKGEVARYYEKISKRMLPHLKNRIISEVRCPKGIDNACFYKKHPAGEKKADGVGVLPLAESDGEMADYYYITAREGILSEVQMNTLEFHTWGSRVDTLEQPDMMVFDLDPDEGLDMDRVRRGVRDLKGLLDQLSLVSYLKTSGGKGYHVVIPLRPAGDWDNFHGFAENIVKTMEAMWPDRYTSNVRKKQRQNRIFIDWIRNGRGATSVAPYSLRARPGATVSMPISWRELDKVAPDEIHMEEALARLRRKDPWEGIYEQNQELKI